MKKLTITTGLSALAMSTVLAPHAIQASDIEENIYIVEKGDSLYHISGKSGIPIDDIKTNNHLKDSFIFIGQKLYLQAPQAVPTDKSVTTIPSGNTIDFSKAIAEAVQKAPSKDKLFTSVLIAQAILESGSGSSVLAANHNNYLGVKGEYQGQTIQLPTQEYVGKRLITINDNFKVYPNPTESIEDYYALFFQSDWSRNHYATFISAKNYKDAANALTGTYATDIHYGEKLINLIEMYDLQIYDGDTYSYSDSKIINYTIKSGDTLNKIARKYKTSSKKIVQQNNIQNPNRIYPNNQLKIEVKQSNVKLKKETAYVNETYAVKSGDTLTKIAENNGTTWSELQTINSLNNPNRLNVGQIIKLK